MQTTLGIGTFFGAADAGGTAGAPEDTEGVAGIGAVEVGVAGTTTVLVSAVRVSVEPQAMVVAEAATAISRKVAVVFIYVPSSDVVSWITNASGCSTGRYTGGGASTRGEPHILLGRGEGF
jgi:hypothetical protein